MPHRSPPTPHDPFQSHSRQPSRPGRPGRRRISTRDLIVILRLIAGAIAIVILIAIWRVLAALPWQIDSLIAVIAVLAWAYWFERGDGG